MIFMWLMHQYYCNSCFSGAINVFGETKRTKISFIDFDETSDIVVACGLSDSTALYGSYAGRTIPMIAKYDWNLNRQWTYGYYINTDPTLVYYPRGIYNCYLSPNNKLVMAETF